MIKKILWKNLMTNLDAKTEFDKFNNEVKAVDDLINAKLSGYSTQSLFKILDLVCDQMLTNNDNGIWADLPVFMSSYREHDKRFIFLLCSNLREYIGFYKAMLTNNGVSRALEYAKTYSNDGEASSTERRTDSETPQNPSLYDSTHPESDTLFDQAIADYASAIGKNKASSTSKSWGGSTTNVSGVTWEEAKKNLQYVFYNELKNFIMSIPERIYSYYSLETTPMPSLLKMAFEDFLATLELESVE